MSYFGNANKEIVCERFEPQTWRKTRCKNCFKTEPEHPLDVEPRVENKEDIEKQKAEKLNKLKGKFEAKSPAVPKKPNSNVLAKSPFAKFQEKEKQKEKDTVAGLKGKQENKILSPSLKRKGSLDKGPFSPKLGAKTLGSPKLGTKPGVNSPKIGAKGVLNDAKKKFEAKTEDIKLTKKTTLDTKKVGSKTDEKDSKASDSKGKGVTTAVNGEIEIKDKPGKPVGSPTEAKDMKLKSLGKNTDKVDSKDAKAGTGVKGSSGASTTEAKQSKSKVTGGEETIMTKDKQSEVSRDKKDKTVEDAAKDEPVAKKDKVPPPTQKKPALLRGQSKEDKAETDVKFKDKEKKEDAIKKDKDKAASSATKKATLSTSKSKEEDKLDSDNKKKETDKSDEKRKEKDANKQAEKTKDDDKDETEKRVQQRRG